MRAADVAIDDEMWRILTSGPCMAWTDVGTLALVSPVGRVELQRIAGAATIENAPTVKRFRDERFVAEGAFAYGARPSRETLRWHVKADHTFDVTGGCFAEAGSWGTPPLRRGHPETSRQINFLWEYRSPVAADCPWPVGLEGGLGSLLEVWFASDGTVFAAGENGHLTGRLVR